MEVYNDSRSVNVNVNMNSNVQLNIGQVLNFVKNKNEAKWFCLQNSNFFYYN